MDGQRICHQPRHMQHTIIRRYEIEQDCLHCPDGQSHIAAQCPDCSCTMVYRGIVRLRAGNLAHYFECVHSHREVHSVSIVITE